MALKILLADDSMTAQNMGKKILVDAGYDVVAVSNGAAAIKKISSEHPDIAILDEYMPGYTGSEVCERVKASAETAKIPVLLTVGKMEPFDQEKANKVHADGVMIKPFEASDLIAAVQSIAQRLLAPSPQPRGVDSTVQLRQAQSASVDDTMRIEPPAPSKVSHEDTLRLTVQQIKAFQDASYHEWKDTAEHHLEAHEKEAIAAEIAAKAEKEAAAAAASEGPAEPAMPMMSEEVAEAPAMAVEAPEAPRETPVFSAMNASGVASEHQIFTVSTTPVARVEEPAAESSSPMLYTPPVMAEAEPETQPMYAVAPVVAEESVAQVPEPAPAVHEAEAETVIAVMEAAPEAVVVPVVAPVLEAVVHAVTIPVEPPAPEPAVVEPAAVQSPAVHFEAEAPAVVELLEPVTSVVAAPAAPVFETSAPLTPGPMPVAPAAGLEPTSAPAVEVAAVPAPELEITSPAQEHGAIVSQDAALVTNTEDMSQFSTRFGVENAEPVHVGVISDLSDEQLAAIMTPPAELHQSVVAEAPVVTHSLESPASPVEEEVGSIHAVEPLDMDEPVLAYVPEIDETGPVTVLHIPEPEPVAEVAPVEAAPEPVELAPAVVVERAAEPAVIVDQHEPAVVIEQAPEPVIEAVPEPVVEEAPAAYTAPEPIVSVVSESVPAIASAKAPVISASEHVPVTAEPSASEHVVDAVAHSTPTLEQHHETAAIVEAALAAAAATAAGIAHVIHVEPPRVEHHQDVAQEPVESHHESDHESHREHFGDAALAEELAAALSNKDTEDRAAAAVEAAASGALQPALAAAAAPRADMGSQTVSDGKLADAVARAFESMKPHLITEIIKELSK